MSRGKHLLIIFHKILRVVCPDDTALFKVVSSIPERALSIVILHIQNHFDYIFFQTSKLIKLSGDSRCSAYSCSEILEYINSIMPHHGMIESLCKKSQKQLCC